MQPRGELILSGEESRSDGERANMLTEVGLGDFEDEAKVWLLEEEADSGEIGWIGDIRIQTRHSFRARRP